MNHTNHYTNGLIKNNDIITDIIELNESDDEEQNHIEQQNSNPFEEEESSSNLSSNDLNKVNKIDKDSYSLNYQKQKSPKILPTFDESIVNLKNNFIKLFNKKNNNTQLDIMDNESFRKTFTFNKNMNLIFQFSDIIKEIYENQLETKMIERNCDINRIIDIYMNKIKKLTKKRKIVIKDYNNLIFVIGAEMHINTTDTQAKEFIVKKRTETLRGNNKINTSDDECYILEINCNKKKKQIFQSLDEVTCALIFLLENLEKIAVFK